MKEIWKDSISLKGTHQVSNHGRVKRLPRLVNSSYGAKRIIKEKIIGHRPGDGGYSRFNITVDGKYKGFLVHRLIAEVFVENPQNLPFVNHIDGNKQNNHPDNLDWCTHQENMIHAVKTGLSKCKKPVISNKNGIGNWYPSLAEASRHGGASKACICAALKHNRQRIAGGLEWEYVLESRGEFNKLQKEQMEKAA